MKIDNKKLALLVANNAMSLKQLSEKSGIGQVTLCRIRKGTQEPRPQTLGKLAQALNCKVEDFLQM